jgi:hypothetical protein
MREMMAIEALKSEKSDKEVSVTLSLTLAFSDPTLARAATIDRHLWRFWTPKAPSM